MARFSQAKGCGAELVTLGMIWGATVREDQLPKARSLVIAPVGMECVVAPGEYGQYAQLLEQPKNYGSLSPRSMDGRPPYLDCKTVVRLVTKPRVDEGIGSEPPLFWLHCGVRTRIETRERT